MFSKDKSHQLAEMINDLLSTKFELLLELPTTSNGVILKYTFSDDSYLYVETFNDDHAKYLIEDLSGGLLYQLEEYGALSGGLRAAHSLLLTLPS